MRFARMRTTRAGTLPGKAVLVGLLLGLAIAAGCWVVPSDSRGPRVRPTGEPAIRVMLLNNVESAQIETDSAPFTLSGLSVTTRRDLVSQSGVVRVNGKPYRGTLRITPEDNGRFDVINIVGVEDYLMGVVTKESPASWPIESLKSQAVTARTYALKSAQDRRGSNFDVWDSTRSQVYGGIDGETDAARRAVDETQGMVLAHGPAGNEKIFNAYFSSTCGGITASAADVFPEDNIPPLRERSADGCTASPRYTWTLTMTNAEAVARLKGWLAKEKSSLAAVASSMNAIRSIEPASANSLGRPTRYTIVDDRGRSMVMSSEDVRMALGFNATAKEKPSSGFFTAQVTAQSITLSGRGFGHGVGMCQYCTQGWAKSGQNYRQILSRSFPGAILVRAY
jgi:stage II sporulation protein D